MSVWPVKLTQLWCEAVNGGPITNSYLGVKSYGATIMANWCYIYTQLFDIHNALPEGKSYL